MAKKTKEEREKEIDRLLEEKGEKDVTPEEFSELVKKVSKKKTAKGQRK